MTETREQDPFELLSAPFPQDIIKWRAQTLTRDHSKAMALAYVDSRDIMDRLDQVISPESWQCDYKDSPTGKLACGIGIRCNDEWIWKWDGAGDTDVEGAKGAFTDSFKRAAVKWGIARYLYALKSPWVPCETYVGNDGKEHFSKFTEDPWDYVSGAPPRNAGGTLAAEKPLNMDAPLGFGKKHKETPIRDVPNEYINWMYENAKQPGWKLLAKRILDARKMDQSPPSEAEDESQISIGKRPGPGQSPLSVPELKEFEKVVSLAAWTAILNERYGAGNTKALTNDQQEDLLAYLQAERDTRGAYVTDPAIGAEVIKALYPHKTYRTLFPAEMKDLRPILDAHKKIAHARDSIDGARIIIQGFESKEHQPIYAATLLQLRGIIEAINGQASPEEAPSGEQPIPF